METAGVAEEQEDSWGQGVAVDQEDSWRQLE